MGIIYFGKLRCWYFLIGISLFTLLSLSSCKKYKPANAAFLINVSEIKVTPQAGQGTGSHLITDVFVYNNGKFQGAYPVGNSFPVVTNNNSVKISVFAAIKNNGISDRRLPWNFYEVIEFDTLVESGKTINRTFNFRYNAAVTFTWMENFDAMGTSLIKSAVSEATVSTFLGAGAFEGYSAIIALSNNQIIAQVESGSLQFVPLSNSNVYLELNYKCDREFTVGTMVNGNYKSAITVSPKTDWHKIYIQLSEVVNAFSTPYQKIVFRMTKEAGSGEAKLYLDNIKLMYL
jgi:hypothetical protein